LTTRPQADQHFRSSNVLGALGFMIAPECNGGALDGSSQ
jgi:hypothetical protein